MLKQWWYQLKHRWIPYCVARLGKLAIHILYSTCQVKVQGLDQLVKAGYKQKCIIMSWHNRLILLPEILTQYAPQFIYAALVSNSRDGELIAVITQSYKNGKAIRVAHNAKYQALQDLVKHIKNHDDVVIITPDGPRGPRYQVKPGVTVAARAADASVVPMSWSASRSWQLRTWDQMIIPKPFSTISVVFGEPVLLSKNNGINYEDDSLNLQNALLSTDLKSSSFI
jgi:lysophospholipid acyltransferase (LPLAT)-like uncharacterized protein